MLCRFTLSFTLSLFGIDTIRLSSKRVARREECCGNRNLGETTPTFSVSNFFVLLSAFNDHCTKTLRDQGCLISFSSFLSSLNSPLLRPNLLLFSLPFMLLSSAFSSITRSRLPIYLLATQVNAARMSTAPQASTEGIDFYSVKTPNGLKASSCSLAHSQLVKMPKGIALRAYKTIADEFR